MTERSQPDMISLFLYTEYKKNFSLKQQKLENLKTTYFNN